MHLELHALQNFALSNLNRDDNGAPKTCEFGGYRRARISSQCLKRAARVHMRTEQIVPGELLSQRSRAFAGEIAKQLGGYGMGGDESKLAAERLLSLLAIKIGKKGTEYLLFMGDRQIERLVQLGWEHRATLTGSADAFKKAAKDLEEPALAAVKQGDAVDLALFGRMIANKPEINVDAAVQMAHAFSTHAVAMEYDYYTAVDDLPGEADETGLGAGMIGSTPFNASCYYRYANLDLRQLLKNLDGNAELARQSVDAFVQSFVEAVPSGKQTGAAAQNPPELVLAVVRQKGLWSLANAFIEPVSPGQKRNLFSASVHALLAQWRTLGDLYGTEGIRTAGLITSHKPAETPAGITVAANFPALRAGLREHIAAGLQ